MLILALGNTLQVWVPKVGWWIGKDRVWEVSCLSSVWYITHGCGSYPALPYPGKRPFQPYTVLGTQGK